MSKNNSLWLIGFLNLSSDSWLTVLICFPLKQVLTYSLQQQCTDRNTEHCAAKYSNCIGKAPVGAPREKLQQNNSSSFLYSVDESSHLTLSLPPILSLHIFLMTPPSFTFMHLQLSALRHHSSVRMWMPWMSTSTLTHRMTHGFTNIRVAFGLT